VSRGMTTVLHWTHWAQRMAAEQQLSVTEAHTLLVLASLGDQNGRGRRTRKELAKALTLSDPKSVTRRVDKLVARGLVARTTKAGESLTWRLNAHLEPVEQLGLDFDAAAANTPDPGHPDASGPTTTRGTQTPRVHPPDATGTRGVQTPRDPGRPDAPHFDSSRTTGEEGERAHAPADEHRPLSALQPRLPDVLAALRRAPDLVVEDLAVDAALAAFPESAGYDHLQAAHAVASHALGERLNFPVANRLLMTELRKQGLAAAAGASTPSRRPPRAAHHRPSRDDGGQISPALKRMMERAGVGDANRRPA
jgi:hypothetical protein